MSIGAVVAVVNCKPEGPHNLIPIFGIVTFKGKPLDECSYIQFEPTDGSCLSMAKTNVDGTFEAVHTAIQKSVNPGENKIVGCWNDPPEITPVPKEFKELFSKYGFTSSEQLTINIEAKDAKFEVKYE